MAKLVNIGFGNTAARNRIISIVSPELAPIKRIVTEASRQGYADRRNLGRRTGRLTGSRPD